jgi:RNA polymerase sigma-54 factor
MLKLIQEMRLTQKLDFRMIQSLKLLPLNIMQLEQRITEELEQNPMLQVDEIVETPDEQSAPDADETGKVSAPREEETDHNGDFTEAEWMRYMDDGFEQDYGGYEEENNRIEERESTHTYTRSMSDHLIEQLGMVVKNEEERALGEFIIGSINDDGFLELTDEEIARDLAIPVEEARRMVAVIQQFDPPGVGARNLREALLIQLREKGLGESVAWRIISNHFEDLTNLRFKQIIQALRITEGEMREALDIIGALSPRPGTAIGVAVNTSVIPDIMVEKVDDDYVVMLMDRHVPHLIISPGYRKLLDKGAKTPAETRKYLVDKLNSARWFINSIEQRRSTIIKVARAIVERQTKFLDHGFSHLRPMTLQDIADTVGVAISTVQRVTTGKYIQTPQGVLELKQFFTQRIASMDGSEDYSARTVKDRMKMLIAEEDPKKPLSDQKLTDLLNESGIDISRRAIAKYRDDLGIPPARLRKRL